MKDWLYHYERAEELLLRSDDPSIGFKREVLIAQAQVHATLATMRHEDLIVRNIALDVPMFDYQEGS